MNVNDITLNADEHRWLLFAELDDGSTEGYTSDIITDADARLAHELEDKGLVEIMTTADDLWLHATAKGHDWLEAHAGEDDCLPVHDNWTWQRILREKPSPGPLGYNVVIGDFDRDDLLELRLLGIIAEQADYDRHVVDITLTEHGADMVRLAHTRLSQ